jgi:NAD+ kinase
MSETNPPPKRFALAVSAQMDDAPQVAEAMSSLLEGEGLTVLRGQIDRESFWQEVAGGMCDVLIALGGDGTMLRAGQACAPLGLPILGINLGRFGFLTEVREDEWETQLQKVLSGEYWLEERMMLRAEHHRGDSVLGEWEVLNECYIGRGEIVRPVRLTAEIDGRFLTTYVVDALIVSTPTGSTAYALAAGGPILPPELRNILIVPVAPHLSVDRAVVLHEGSWVRVMVRTDHTAILSTDGLPAIPLQDEDHIDIRAGEHTVEFVRLQDPGYFYRNLTSQMNRNPSAGDP